MGTFRVQATSCCVSRTAVVDVLQLLKPSDGILARITHGWMVMLLECSFPSMMTTAFHAIAPQGTPKSHVHETYLSSAKPTPPLVQSTRDNTPKRRCRTLGFHLLRLCAGLWLDSTLKPSAQDTTWLLSGTLYGHTVLRALVSIYRPCSDRHRGSSPPSYSVGSRICLELRERVVSWT